MKKIQIAKNAQIMSGPPKTLDSILKKLRLIKNEVMFLFPQEDLEDYTNADRIKDSYHKAIKEHPPTLSQYGNSQN